MTKLSYETIPQQVNLHLTQAQRSYLAHLHKEYPDFQRLLTRVMEKGLTALMQESSGLTPEEKIEAKEKSERPAVAPSFVSGKRRTVASSELRSEQVENYVGFSIDGRTQERLQEFLNAQPDASLEEACQTLLQLGLHQAESDMRSVRRSLVLREGDETPSEKAESMAHLAEGLWLHSKAICGF